MNTLNITIGPVQSFVVQARRTRDLWSGSFLLSYLTGCAMHGAELASGNKVLEPVIENDRLMTLIREGTLSDNKKKNLIGSLPNRFKIECDEPDSVEKASKKAFDEAWLKIADAVWSRYLASIDVGNGTKEIWDRQVKDFWDFNWTVGEQWTVDARKNWRRQNIPEEGGDHCTLMNDYQELSGHIRYKNGNKQKEFWKEVNRKTGKLDLKDDERLCAIAFIKRFFPSVAGEIIGNVFTSKHWPSTVYMAAVPWLKKLDEEDKRRLDEYYDEAKKIGQNVLRPVIPEKLGLDLGRFAQLDGNFYFKELLRSEKSTPITGCPKEDRKKLVELLGKVKSKPSPYYVLLLMDGDNLGKMKRENRGKTNEISQALSKFSQQVPEIVKKNNGVTIYAGGDDVLAMLPMDTALKCSNILSDVYRSSFTDTGIETTITTISAGLVYTHYHMPFQSVYREAHHLLDDIAKNRNGRNSIALSVWKGSGKYLQWVSKWDRKDGNVSDLISDAVMRYYNEKIFSSSLMYSVRESMALLTDVHNWKPGEEMDLGKSLDSNLDIKKLIVADIMRSNVGKMEHGTVESELEPILNLCYKYDENEKKYLNTTFSIDGWFLIRFLSKGGD